MSLRAGPAGAKAWVCWRSLAARFSTRSLRWNSRSRDSHEDNYAQQLEPALGRLAADIQSGFHYLASCIHGWRFHIPPPAINLEEDIAQLEARMDDVRPYGLEFSQAEILRAYAVQLHLKQIARLLRASRVETSRAIGEAQQMS